MGWRRLGRRHFYECTSLKRINIPPAVRAIKEEAFRNCDGLTTAILRDGLEQIRARAILQCRSLVHIDISPNIRTIKRGAFRGCSGLMTAILGNGLEEIRERAFYDAGS